MSIKGFRITLAVSVVFWGGLFFLLSGCATISQELVSVTDGITKRCTLQAKGYIGSAESTMMCKSYDEQGDYIVGSDTFTKTEMN